MHAKHQLRKSHKVRNTLIVLGAAVALCATAVFAIDAYVRSEGDRYLVGQDQVPTLNNVDCILVLGCGVYSDGSPTPMLHDRLSEGIKLYKKGVAPKLLMSGDHGQVDYNEVGTMKQLAIDAGIPSEDVFMDHAGFSTYESMRRARDVFGAQKIVVVSQGYHLYRSLFLANRLGLEAYGVAADYRDYSGQTMRDLREIMARNKDFFSILTQPDPTFLGEAIDLRGNGDITNG